MSMLNTPIEKLGFFGDEIDNNNYYKLVFIKSEKRNFEDAGRQ